MIGRVKSCRPDDACRALADLQIAVGVAADIECAISYAGPPPQVVVSCHRGNTWSRVPRVKGNTGRAHGIYTPLSTRKSWQSANPNLPIGRKGHHPRSTCFHRSNGQTRRCHPSAGRSAHPPDSVARHRARCTFDRPRIDPSMQVNRWRRKWDGQEDLLRAPSIKTRGIKPFDRGRSSGAIPFFFPPSNSIVDPRDGGVNTCPWVRRLFSTSSSRGKTRPSAAILPSFYNDGEHLAHEAEPRRVYTRTLVFTRGVSRKG